jgi:transcriptional regulator with XRE-family HTH domain
MNPFSKEIRRLRKLKGIRQKDAAEMLKSEQSYLSAIELGLKDPPRDPGFLERLVQTYNLTQEEQLHLQDLLRLSNRVITIPKKASEAEFYLGHQLEQKFGSLSPDQIHLINVVLNMNATSINDFMRRTTM